MLIDGTNKFAEKMIAEKKKGWEVDSRKSMEEVEGCNYEGDERDPCCHHQYGCPQLS